MEKVCIICKKVILYEKRFSKILWKRKKVCSNGCKWKYYSQLYKNKSGRKHTEQEKKALSEKLKGRKKSEETKRRMSLYQKSSKHPWTSKRNHENRGEKSPNWRGGSSKMNAKIRSSKEYRQWEKKVLQRDNSTCVKCKTKEKIGADHTKPFSLFPELRFEIKNGQALCKKCHREKNIEDMRLIRATYIKEKSIKTPL